MKKKEILFNVAATVLICCAFPFIFLVMGVDWLLSHLTIIEPMPKPDRAECCCDICGWDGQFKELLRFDKSEYEYCPECGTPGSVTECDAVDFNSEYGKQERINL